MSVFILLLLAAVFIQGPVFWYLHDVPAVLPDSTPCLAVLVSTGLHCHSSGLSYERLPHLFLSQPILHCTALHCTE